MTRRAHINSTRPLAPFLLLTLRIFVLLLVVSALASAQAPRNATGAPRTEAAIETQQQGDTARFRARWSFACDVGGCPDSVLVTWTTNGIGRATKGTRAKGDTVSTLRTICPGVTAASAAIVAMRRGRPSAQLVRSATMGCRDVAPPPVDSFVIDTGNVWRSALRVDSIPLPLTDTRSGWYQVTRADSSVAMVHTIRSMKQPFAIVGATNTAPTGCADGMWYALGDTVSLNVAKARAAQWPTDALTTRARSTWLARDYSQWPTGAVWQGRCG